MGLEQRVAKFISSGILSLMKQFLVMTICLICLLPALHAQEEADERYVTIYNLIQQGDGVADAQPKDALQIYIDAQARLQKFHRMYPAWDPGIVNYRLDDLDKKISHLNVVLTPKVVAPPVDAGAGVTPQVQAQMTALQMQLQQAKTENQTLQAKLKEALATQPAVIDASELEQAQEQVRALMKQNALLQVGGKPGTGAVTNMLEVTNMTEITHLKDQLTQSSKKLNDEHARAQTMMTENESLQKNLSRAGMDSSSLDLLQSENQRLKDQLGSLQVAANNAAASQEMASRLKDANTQIATLSAASALANLEKAALENKVRKLSSQLAQTAANYEGQIHDLTEQRNDLLKLLAVASASNSHHQMSDVAAQITELNNEVNVLRSRVAVDESKPIPFTADELALFRAAPTAEPVRRSITEMPPGTAELVASAQKHFANHEFDQAEADYLKILSHDENNGLALANLATIELQEGKYDDAEKHIKAALVQSPDDSYNLSTLGYLKFRQGKYDDALNTLSRAVKIDPNNPETENYLGVTFSHKGLRVQAESALRKALQLDPNYAPAHNNIALIYLTQTPPLPQLARWHYQKALDAGQPRNPDLEKMLADKGAPVYQ